MQNNMDTLQNKTAEPLKCWKRIRIYGKNPTVDVCMWEIYRFSSEIDY